MYYPAENKLDGRSDCPDLFPASIGLIAVTTVLISFGLTMLYSASFTVSGTSFFTKQLIWVLCGTAGGTVIYLFGYRRVASMRGAWLLLCWIMLTAALGFDPVNGARRWIRLSCPGLGEVTLQPSEFAKIAICFFVAGYCTEFPRTFSNLKSRYGILSLAGYVAVTGGLVWLGKDLGTCLLILSSAGAIMVAAGLYMRYVFLGVSFAALGVGIILCVDQERLSRVMTFGDPLKDALGGGYQLGRSLMALGSGGWRGIGFGQSRLKAKYLPEQHTDFILAVIGEELGVVVILLIVLLYILWGCFAFRIALGSRNKLGMLLGCGLAVAVQLQAVINMAVVSGSAPTKGMPAPFLSYGGSNIIASIMAVAVLLSIARENTQTDYSDRFVSGLKKILRIKK